MTLDDISKEIARRLSPGIGTSQTPKSYADTLETVYLHITTGVPLVPDSSLSKESLDAALSKAQDRLMASLPAKASADHLKLYRRAAVTELVRTALRSPLESSVDRLKEHIDALRAHG